MNLSDFLKESITCNSLIVVLVSPLFMSILTKVLESKFCMDSNVAVFLAAQGLAHFCWVLAAPLAINEKAREP